MAYYLVVKVFVWLSGKPADREHPYGHHQYESSASVVVGASVVAAAIAIFWDSANKAFDLAMGKLEKPPIALFTLVVALATAAVKVGLMAYTKAARGLLWVDPVAGAVVSLVILKTGIEILRESSTELMDTVPGEPLARKVRGLFSGLEGVEEVEEVHANRFGPYHVVNLNLGVNGEMTVLQGDAIATRAERLLCQRMELVRKVYVHYHPAGKRGAPS